MNSHEQKVRTWSMLCHLSALAGLIFGLGSVLAPLLVWQIKKNELPEIEPHGKEALNFQITILIINIIGGMLLIGFVGATWGIGRRMWTNPIALLSGGFGIGSVLVIINLVAMILAVIAGIKANNGEPYKYPFAIRIIK